MKRITALLLALVLALSMLSACGAQTQASETVSSAPAEESVEAPVQDDATDAPEVAEEPQASEDASAEEPAPVVESYLPLVEEKETLTIYNTWNPVDESILNEMEDYMAITEAEELTNVHIDWTTAPGMSYSELFNIMLAAGDYCDILSGFNYAYSSGVAGGLEEELIINIYDYLEEYAPHYSALIDDIDYGWAQVSVDKGEVGAIYTLMENPRYTGMLIRGDWLEELGLEAPETYDEWHDVLTAMKNEYGAYGFCMSSMCLEYYAFAGGFGTPGYAMSFFGSGSYWYQVDGVVKNALVEDGFREYLELMNQYYEEGLISPDFISVSEMGNDASKVGDMANGVYASFCIQDSGIDTLYDTTLDEDFYLVPCSQPVKNAGDKIHFMDYAPVNNNASAFSVSTACEKPELAVAWLDFWFSDEGIMLGNVGVEDVTYEVRDGDIYYTDLILNSEYTMETATQMYVPVGMIATIRIDVTTSFSDARREADAKWVESADHDYVLPTINLTTEETVSYNQGLGDLETYAQESIPAFINGTKSFDEWDSYVEALESLGITEKTEIYQAALDRMAE